MAKVAKAVNAGIPDKSDKSGKGLAKVAKVAQVSWKVGLAKGPLPHLPGMPGNLHAHKKSTKSAAENSKRAQPLLNQMMVC